MRATLSSAAPSMSYGEHAVMGAFTQNVQRGDRWAGAGRGKSVSWDQTGAETEAYVVKTVGEPEINPLTCVLRFARVGKYSIAEQRTYLAPPKIPSAPGKQVPVPDASGTSLQILVGVLLAFNSLPALSSCSRASGYGDLVGGIGLINAYLPFQFLLVGICLACVGMGRSGARSAAVKRNESVRQEEQLWFDAWSNWEKLVFFRAFQDPSDGQVSRVYQTVFDCIRQLNDELFRGVQMHEERDDASSHELMQSIEAHKENYH